MFASDAAARYAFDLIFARRLLGLVDLNLTGLTTGGDEVPSSLCKLTEVGWVPLISLMGCPKDDSELVIPRTEVTQWSLLNAIGFESDFINVLAIGIVF
ncbi:hypothetical protein [Paraburkholderia sp. 31.1]|uniref:hypothetical protein n=1 Tax=Paraburkholderia sp. 31.1 TaxID=2615205 RepID=UPI0016550F46|nr:hypothetical protein [Paraburkholderia sp. 31.1]